MIRSLALSLAFLVICVSTAAAGSPPVKKPSEIVMLRPGGTSGCNSNEHEAFNTDPAGNSFTIPAGFVLLVTDISFVSVGADVLEVTLNDDVSLNEVVAYLGVQNTAGTQEWGSVHFATPLVVKSNQTLCIGQPTFPTSLSARLIGTLAKDK